MNNGGDILARGGKSALFLPARVSKEKWDTAFRDFDPTKESKIVKKENDNRKFTK